MKQRIIIQLLTVILKSLSPDIMRRVADAMLDIVESKVVSTPNKIDDVLILPLCRKIREAFEIEE